MKKYLVVLLIIVSSYACNTSPKVDNETDKRLDSLAMINHQLQTDAESKDSSINSYMLSLNEIESTLTTIKEKQQVLSKNKNIERQGSRQDQIVEDIKLIAELMNKNRTELASLKGRFKKQGVKIKELEKMIDNLTAKLSQQDSAIAFLQDSLGRVNSNLKVAFEQYNTKVGELDEQTKKLHTAYYTIGTYKELKEHGIITKEGGLLGIGRTQGLSNDFKKDYFTKIDITQTTSIPINNAEIKVLTKHPSASYSFAKNEKSKNDKDKKVQSITISNPDDFWSTSKYLVVVVE
jgi:hypothetical protein